jgi:type VI secretion system secreted protein VgrG
LQQSAVRHHATAVKAGVVLFTYGKAQAASKPNKEVGIAIHSSTGSWASHSLTAATKVTADKAITVSSTQARVLISAPKHVLLTAAGAAIRIEGGNITLTAPGKVEFKASMKELAGGASVKSPPPYLPKLADLKNWIAIQHRDPEGEPMVGQKYKIFFENGTVIEGKLDAKGYARHDGVPPAAERVEYEPREPEKDKPWDALAKMVSAAQSKFG